MWGSIPYHAHNFLIRFTIGVRTTIEYLITIKYLLKTLAMQNNPPILTAVCNFGVLGLGAVCSAFSDASVYTYILYISSIKANTNVSNICSPSLKLGRLRAYMLGSMALLVSPLHFL